MSQWTLSAPIGVQLPKNIFTQDISSDDYVNGEGFLVTAVAAGDLVFRPIGGSADVTRTVAAGDRILACGIPLICGAVRANSTIGSVEITTF